MSAPDLTARLDEIEARANAATHGPWEHVPWGGQNQNGDYAGGHVFDADGEYVVADVSDADGALIAHARTDVPALVAALRAVLALSARDLDDSPDHEVPIWDSGFNAALGDVRAAITSALGGAR